MASHRHRTHGSTRPRERRFFGSGELHLVLLALVARRPQHGYDLMAELSALFGPDYRPSPGSIYPALSALESEGLVESRDEGDRRVHFATEVGRRALTDRQATLAAVEARTGARLTGVSVEPALARLTARVRAAAGEVEAADVERILDAAGDEVERLAAHKAGPTTEVEPR
ncbi:MAG TPA: PadR family transcriptional regulator [Acidimicrobiia bacterium]|nr:PadR family transcriptional regulator [Acidimicrobiia bacterium]